MRFDLGTRFGPDCVDLQRVSLPRPASSYVDPSTGTEDAGPLIHDLRPRLGAQPGVRIYLVYVEIENRAAGGLASIIDDDTPTGASHAIGDRFAFVFSPVASGDIDPQHMAAAGTHEVFHLLGAVQKSAPNHGSSGRGHCDDSSFDLMCRGGAGCELRQHTTTVLLFPLDCNRDDYFNPDPPPGSYLATHWNTYNSPFLCAVGTCVPDNVGPSTKVKGPRRTSDRTPTFNLRADEPEVEFECKIDKGKRRSCGKRFVAPKLEPGKHKLAVTAIDEAGNADPTPDVRRFEITD